MMEWIQSSQAQHDAFTWFTQSQLHSVVKNGIVPEWFHGIISRKTAEELLMSKPPGYFLIRVSESRVGYTLSYRVEDRYRHFMIDALENGDYIIVGDNRRHQCLQDLVDFHRRTPISPFSEVLTVACGQSSIDKTNYAELLFPKRHQNPDSSLPQNNSLQPKSHPVPREDIPPALPYRPTNLKCLTVLPPNSQTNRLYPCLEEEFHISSPLSATPMPMTRKQFAADNLPVNQPPEVPVRSFVAVKQNQAIRTSSAPMRSSSPTVNEATVGTNTCPVKIQEAKVSVATNLKNLKKIFQKNRSASQENMYSEIVVETDRSGDTENEYQEIAGEHTIHGATCSKTDVTQSKGALHPSVKSEYLPPPPFAPGY